MPSTPPRKRLERLAESLAPEQLPYHVDHVDRAHRAPGWYWQPAGVTHAVFLGYNHIIAEIALLEVDDRRTSAA